MLTKQRFVLYGMNLIFDSLFLFLVYVLFLQGASWSDLGLFVLIMLPIVVVSGILYIVKPSLVKLTLACTIGLSFITFWLLTSSLLFSLVIALIIAWRSTENWQDPLKADIEVILMISATMTVFLSLFLKEGFSVMYGAVWVQFMLMLSIKMYVHYLKNPSAEKVWKDFSIPLTLMGLSVFMFVFLGPLKTLVNLIIDGILFVLYYVVAIPVWNLINIIFIPLIRFFKKDDDEVKKNLGELTEEIIEKKPPELAVIDYTFIFWSTITLLVLIIFLYIWKKKIKLNLQNDALLSGNVSSLQIDQHGYSLGKRKWLQTKDRTRKKFLNFEKTMDKRGFSRMPGESAFLWFERLKLSGDEAAVVISAYEKVRYGDDQLSNDEFTDYAKAIKKLEKSEHLQRKKST